MKSKRITVACTGYVHKLSFYPLTTVLLSINKFFFCFYRLTAEIKKRQSGVATMWQKERKEMRLNTFAGFMSVVALAAVLEK